MKAVWVVEKMEPVNAEGEKKIDLLGDQTHASEKI